jgi:hypothetical protein
VVPAVRHDSAGQAAFRLATASASSVRADPTASTDRDSVAGDSGFATSDTDDPDLVFSSTYLHLSTDVFSAGGRPVVRIPLAHLAAGGHQLRRHRPGTQHPHRSVLRRRPHHAAARRDRSLFAAFGHFVTDVAGDPSSCAYHPSAVAAAADRRGVICVAFSS